MSSMTVTGIDIRSRPIHDSPSRSFTIADAHEMWRRKFAPWVQSLGLVMEECSDGRVRMRLPYSPALTRFGNTVCGQALMACADSAMAIALMSSFGEFRNATTVSQSISFMRSIANADVLIDATVKKTGKTLVFAEASFRSASDDRLAAHAISTWMLVS